MDKLLQRYNSFLELPLTANRQILTEGEELLNRKSSLSKQNLAEIFHRMGEVLFIQGKILLAQKHLNQGHSLCFESGDFSGLLKTELLYGSIKHSLAHHESALSQWLSVRDQANELQQHPWALEACYNLLKLSFEQENDAQGHSFLIEAQQIMEKNAPLSLFTLTQALYYVETEHWLEANQQLKMLPAKSVTHSQDFEQKILQARILAGLNNRDESLALLDDLYHFCHNAQILKWKSLTLLSLGHVEYQFGQIHQAEQHWMEGRHIAQKYGFRNDLLRLNDALTILYHNENKWKSTWPLFQEMRSEIRKTREERFRNSIHHHKRKTHLSELEQQVYTWQRRSGELERIRETMDESIRELEAVKEIGEAITATLHPEVIIDVLHKRLSSLIPVDGLIIGFLNQNDQSLDLRYIIDEGQHLPAQRIPLRPHESLSALSISQNKDLRIDSRSEAIQKVPFLRSLPGGRCGNESFLLVRLRINGNTIGVLSVQAKTQHCYKERHLELLRALAGFVAISLSNSNAHQDLLTANARIAHMATHDALTGLPNRVQIMSRLKQEIYRCRRYKQALAVLFIDLDGFKAINDNYGHRAGDAALIETARRLKNNIRSTDAVGRLAGDEFLVVFTDDCTSDFANNLAELLRKSLEKPIEALRNVVSVSASIGLAIFPEDGESPEELINASDNAMYVAKRKGKNRVVREKNFTFNSLSMKI
ncbi:MAG: sensor domain-containing diguanylate cyclase [Spirochaetales bacterium]|nr:sensor domain-containing diguanylate cyclase [Spirochaetales bacterium]